MKYSILRKMLRVLLVTVVVFVNASFLTLSVVEAADVAANPDTSGYKAVSVLPEATDPNECKGKYDPDVQGYDKVVEDLKNGNSDTINNWLGCGIKTGNIKLYMVPYYVRSILEFIIGISGLACVGAIIFGGYWYLFAGISEDKERGKKAILHGVIGMVLTLVAWAIVNILISLFTL